MISSLTGPVSMHTILKLFYVERWALSNSSATTKKQTDFDQEAIKFTDGAIARL